MVSFNNEWCLKGAKEAQDEEDDGTVMILDTGSTKAMCSRPVYHLMRRGLSADQVELLPDSSTFANLLPESSTLNFANGQRALASEKCRATFVHRLLHYR